MLLIFVTYIDVYLYGIGKINTLIIIRFHALLLFIRLKQNGLTIKNERYVRVDKLSIGSSITNILINFFTNLQFFFLLKTFRHVNIR